jgi:hypothetical protein
MRWPHVEQSAPNERSTVHADFLPHRGFGEAALEVCDMPIGISHRSNDRKGIRDRLEYFKPAHPG